MPVQNVSFEVAESGSAVSQEGGEYEANYWTLFEHTTAVEFAAFGNAQVTTEAEWFETDWENNDFIYAFVGVPYDLGSYIFNPGPTPSTVEDFEQGWYDNEHFLFELVRREECPFSSGDLVETFEIGWDNDSFIFVFSVPETQLEAATVSPETFETSWGVDDYLWEFDDPGTQLEAVSIYFASGDYRGYETFVNPQNYEYWVGMSGSEPIAADIDFIITVNGAEARYQSGSGDTREIVTDALVEALNGLSGVKSEESTLYASNIEVGATDPSKIFDPEFDFVVEAKIENNQGTNVNLTVGWYGSQPSTWPQSSIMKTIPIV